MKSCIVSFNIGILRRFQIRQKMLCLHLLWAAAVLVRATNPIDESAFAPEDCIEKDVAIIGGGASGTYAAVRLREDLDKSIILIERDDHLVRVDTHHTIWRSVSY